MKKITYNISEPMGLGNFPHVSLIIPFNPEMTKPKGLINLLALAVDKMEYELKIKYPIEQSVPLIKRLRDTIQEVKSSTNEKTLAIFVSLLAKKICYFTPSNPKKAYMPAVLILPDN